MADVEERALGWEDELENVSGFPLLPEGDYPFIIEKFDRTRTGSEGKYPNNNMATVYFRVSDNNNTTVTIKENFILNVNFFKFIEIFNIQTVPFEIIAFLFLSKSKNKQNSFLPFMMFPLYSLIFPP